MIMQQGEDGEGEEGGSERVEGEGGEEDWVTGGQQQHQGMPAWSSM